MSTITDKDLIAFKAISSFITELNTLFGKKHHPLRLYNRLISQTTLTHESGIIKNIETFKAFCIDNREQIKNRTHNNLNGNISYSTRVFIDLKDILSQPDNDSETIDAIWNHMLAISAIVDPENKTKEILKKRLKKTHKTSNSGVASSKGMDLIGNLMGSLQNQIGQTDMIDSSGGDPMKLISNIMSSGIFNNMLSQVTNSFKDQKLDLNDIMGATQSILSNLQKDNGDGKMLDLQSLVSGVMSNIQKQDPENLNQSDNSSSLQQPNTSSVDSIQSTNSSSFDSIQQTNSSSFDPIQQTNSSSFDSIQQTNSSSFDSIQQTNSSSFDPIQLTNSSSFDPIQQTNSSSFDFIQLTDHKTDNPFEYIHMPTELVTVTPPSEDVEFKQL